MAFVSASATSLARDLWPGDKGRMISDPTTMHTLPPHRIVPRTYEELCRWLCVDPCGVDSPCSVWLHPDVVGEDTRVEMTIRLQGFVEEVSVGMLGNWTGTPEGAPKAMQTLTLVSGRCHEAFDAQLQALDNIRELVLKLLSRSSAVGATHDGKIRLKRRVFERVRPYDDDGMNIRIPLAEDPVGRAKKLEHLWAVRHRIEGGAQRHDGRIQRENPRVIRPGDFVDVGVTVQAVSLRLPKGRRGIDIMFVPQTIIRLVSSEESVVLLQAIDAEQEAQEPIDEVVTVRRDVGFAFDGDGEIMGDE